MEKEECSICFFQYDKNHKVPRILRCGHTFCQTCLEEIKIPNKHSISCPNCRVLTENVICTKNLPENEGVFQQQPNMFSSSNMNSPYEAAKRLFRESELLYNTGERFLTYLDNLETHDKQADEIIIKNICEEYEKVETLAQTIINMVQSYKEKLQARLSDNMNKQRMQINYHLKEIQNKKEETMSILRKIDEEIKEELDGVKANEQNFLKVQMEEQLSHEQEQRTIEINEVIKRQGSDKAPVIEQIKGQGMQECEIIIEEKISPIASNNDESSNSSCQGVNNMHDTSKSNVSDDMSTDRQAQICNYQKEDRKRVNQIRTQFYSLNQEFEQLLKFKPISNYTKWQLELNLLSVYNIFSSIRLEERTISFQDQLKQLETQLDLRDYYYIKRPTVIFFSNIPSIQGQVGDFSSNFLKIVRLDIISQTQSQSFVKIPNQRHQHSINLANCRTLTHPSKNSMFLLEGSTIYLFDNENDILLSKPTFTQIEQITRQAVCYNEGFIYFIGGYDVNTQKSVKHCSRYNIVTETWQQLSPTLFDNMDSSACPINEYQIVLIGGVNSQGKLTDLVEIYDVRENTWRLFEIGLSSPRRLTSAISSQKDRVIIIGGKERDGKDSRTVEEIDFIKRNLVNLAHLNHGRTLCNAFLFNDEIYAFGGSNESNHQIANKQKDFAFWNSNHEKIQGEKYTISENRWREVIINPNSEMMNNITFNENKGKIDNDKVKKELISDLKSRTYNNVNSLKNYYSNMFLL